MKFILPSLLALLSTSAFASHPHDRSCVGSAAIKGQGPVEFVLQWEIGRMYDHGGPNEDTHELSFDVSSCYGDYADAECSQYTQEHVLLQPEDNTQTVPVSLKNAAGEVFFEGKFSWAKQEKLVGKISKGPGRNDNDKELTADVTVLLNCVSQPKMKLTPAE